MTTSCLHSSLLLIEIEVCMHTCWWYTWCACVFWEVPPPNSSQSQLLPELPVLCILGPPTNEAVLTSLFLFLKLLLWPFLVLLYLWWICFQPYCDTLGKERPFFSYLKLTSLNLNVSGIVLYSASHTKPLQKILTVPFYCSHWENNSQLQPAYHWHF